MDLETASECNTTANITANVPSCPQAIPAPPSGPIVNPYNKFYKFRFGSAIYMIILSFINIVANGLLLLVFFIDPLKIFRNATTYFLIGIAFVDIFIAATQQPMYSTCFIMMYIRHPDAVKTCTNLLNIGQTISLTAMNASFLIVSECNTTANITANVPSCPQAIPALALSPSAVPSAVPKLYLVSHRFSSCLYCHTVRCVDFASESRAKGDENARDHLRVSHLHICHTVQCNSRNGCPQRYPAKN